MRRTLSLLCLLVVLAFAVPAQAQLRVNAGVQRSPTKLFGDSGAGFLLNTLFSPEHFRMSHSYEMSFGSYGGESTSLGMYTNTMQWQFNNKLAARVDVAVAHSPFGNSLFKNSGVGETGAQVFLRNAEIAYRPSERVLFQLSVHQSPYGSYMSPYGFYGPFGYGYDRFSAGFGSRAEDLFFRDSGR